MTPAEARAHVLRIYREHYGKEQSDEEALATDPNGFDKDPGPFYEQLTDELGLADHVDEGEGYFGGLGGRLAETIAVVAEHGSYEEHGDELGEVDAALKENLELFLCNVRLGFRKGNLGAGVYNGMSSIQAMDRRDFAQLRRVAESAESDPVLFRTIDEARAKELPALPSERIPELLKLMRSYPDIPR